MVAPALSVTTVALWEGKQELHGTETQSTKPDGRCVEHRSAAATVKGKVINGLFSVVTATSNRSGVGMVARAATAWC